MKPKMVYGQNLIVLLVFCARRVASLPFAEEEVGRRVHRDFDLPANQYANQQYQTSTYAQPQTVDLVDNIYQQPNNQEYRQQKKYYGNNRLRDQPVLPQVAEKNEPLSGIVNERQINNNRFKNGLQDNLSGNFVVNDFVNERSSLSTVEVPYRHTTQYEYPEFVNEKYPANIRHQYQRRPFNGAQEQARITKADNLKTIGRVEDSQPRRPEKVSRVARPRTPLNPGYNIDQSLLHTQANDYLLNDYLPITKKYTTVHPNGTREYLDKPEGGSRNYENYVYTNAEDVISTRSKPETIQRLKTPVDISDIDKLISEKPDNIQRDFTDTNAYQYNFQAPTSKTGFVYPQYSYEYDLPRYSDTIAEFRPYVKETSFYNSQNFVETPTDTLTNIPRFRSSSINDFSNTGISNDVPRKHLVDIQNKNLISSANSDTDYAPNSREVIAISHIKTPTIQSTRTTEGDIHNPSISHINSGGSMNVLYKNTQKLLLDNNPSVSSTNTDFSNIPYADEIITTSPITNSNNEPSLMLETGEHNLPIQSSITHVSDVLYDNDGTKILAIENLNDESISSQVKDKFHLNSLTISSMDKYISDLAKEDEETDEESAHIEKLNENTFIEPFIENISSERISRVSQGEDSTVAESAPEPIQKMFGNVLKDIIGDNELNHIVTENDKIHLEKDVLSPVQENIEYHTEATLDDIPNPFINNQSYEVPIGRKTIDILNPSVETESNLNPFYKIGQTEGVNTGNVYASDESRAVIATKISDIDNKSYAPVSSHDKDIFQMNNFGESGLSGYMDSYISNLAKDDEVITISPIETNDEHSSGSYKLNTDMPIEPFMENISSERIIRFSQEENSPVAVLAPEPIQQTIGNVLEDNIDHRYSIEPINLFTKNDKTSFKKDVSSPIEEIIVVNEPMNLFTENDKTSLEKDVSRTVEEIIVINEPINLFNENDKTSLEKGVSNPVEEIIIVNEPINLFTENDKTSLEKDLSSPADEIIVINEPINLFTENDKTRLEKVVSNPVEDIIVINTEATSDHAPNAIIENKSYPSPLDRKTDDILKPLMKTERLSEFNSLHEISKTEDTGPVDDDSSAFVDNGSILRASFESLSDEGIKPFIGLASKTEGDSSFESVNDEGIKPFIGPTSNTEGLSILEEPVTGNNPTSLVKNDLGDNTITISHIEVPAESATQDVSYSESNILYKIQSSGNREAEIEPQEMAATATPINTNIQITEFTDTNQSTNIDIVNEKTDKSEVWFKIDADFWDKLSHGDINYDVVYLFQVHDQPVVEKTTKTTVYPNGTIIQEHFETTWDYKDTKPIIIQSSGTIDSDKDTGGQVVTL